MQDLTKPQKLVLSFLQTFITRNGYPPTRKQIAEKMGYSSLNSANGHLRALASKGQIELSAGVGRGIKILHPTKGNGK